ncbi:MAG: HlyD family secretion protein, partial [Rhodospirillales bacterium]|nr:HlyD family secretion protein [Rhodospirillales bacterium]
PLILLDPRDATARLAQARGAQAEAAAAAMTARRQVTQSRSAIAQAGAMLAQAHADAVQTQADAARSGQLVRGGWTSRQANELAATQAAKAQSAVAAAEAAEAAARQAEAVAEAQVMQADAKLESATAAVTLASNSLADTVIRAPIDGIVGNRAAQLGQHVQPGQQLISVTPDAAQLYVVANFKETQLARMHAGQPVDLIADIDSGKVIHGRVDSLAPATGALFSLLPPENATGNFTKVVQRVPVKVVLDPGEAARAKWLRAGLSVTSEVDTRAKPEPRLGIWGDAMATLRRK